MSELKDIVVYIIKNYPRNDELSKARLTKMVYLADWKSAIDRERQMTKIRWEFNHYGPYVHDVVDLAESHVWLFKLKSTTNFYGQNKELLVLRDKTYEPEITNSEKKILDHVITKTADKTWDSFIRLVYSTYPIRTQPRYKKLNLVELAREYQAEKKSILIASR